MPRPYDTDDTGREFLEQKATDDRAREAPAQPYSGDKVLIDIINEGSAAYDSLRTTEPPRLPESSNEVSETLSGYAVDGRLRHVYAQDGRVVMELLGDAGEFHRTQFAPPDMAQLTALVLDHVYKGKERITIRSSPTDSPCIIADNVSALYVSPLVVSSTKKDE